MMDRVHDHDESPIGFTWKKTKLDDDVTLLTPEPFCVDCKAHLQLTDRQVIDAMSNIFATYEFKKKSGDERGAKKILRNQKAEGHTHRT
jgi:hypothetical protein